MNGIIECKPKYMLSYLMVPSIVLFFVALYNLSSSFLFDIPKIVFCMFNFAFVVFSMSFLGDILEKNFIDSSKTSLLSAGLTLASLYLILDEKFLSSCFSNLIIAHSISNYIMLYVTCLSHIINSIFTVIFCVSLIIFSAQVLLGSFLKFVTFKDVSFSLVRQIGLIFIISLTFKSILVMIF